MIKDALTNLAGGEYFATIPLVIFVLVFIGVIFWTFKLDRSSIDQWSHIPLEDNPSGNNDRESD